MIVENELLGRELIKIYQDTELFNFSIDSMLLASFATVSYKTKEICDLCTGNAPVPLYLSLRSNAHITGVEYLKESYDLAIKSIDANNLSSRIDVYNDNLIDIHKKIGENKFDLVTCNPPFFKMGCHNVNPNDKKAIARHEILANLDDICKEASLLLKYGGHFTMVHRPDRLFEIIDTLRKYKIEPKRLRLVHPHLGDECNHILIEGVKDGKPGLRVLPPLIVYDDANKWTEEVLNIYNYKE